MALAGDTIRISIDTRVSTLEDHEDDIYYSALSTDLSLTGSESAVVLSGSCTFKAGRAYEVEVGERLTTSGTTNTARVRFYSAGSMLVDLGGVGASQGGNTFGFLVGGNVINSSSSDMTRTVGVTMQMSANTGTWNGGSGYPRFLRIKDCGPATSYSGATAVV